MALTAALAVAVAASAQVPEVLLHLVKVITVAIASAAIPRLAAAGRVRLELMP
jgi:hypothetical protein